MLNWCPTCDIHLNETLGGFGSRSFDFEHVTRYLLERAGDLQACFTNPVRKRIVLHAHRGAQQISEDVQTLLTSIPDLDVIETVWESSYTCGRSGSAKTPELRDVEHGRLLERVRAHRADALVTLFHSCHMAFVGQEMSGEFQVLNFTDLLAQAVGRVPSTDRLKHFRLLDDWPAIVADVRPFLEENQLPVDLEWLEKNGARLISLAEFSSDFDCTGAVRGRTG